MSARSLTVREVQAGPEQLLVLAATQPDLFPVLFDSAAAGPLGRFTILAALPGEALLSYGDGRVELRGTRLPDGDFLEALDQWWQHECGAEHELSLPFRGGWVVYLGYELAARIEPGLRLPALPAAQICAMALRVPAALVYDHAAGRCWLVDDGSAVAAGERIGSAVAAIGAHAAIGAPGNPNAVFEQEPARFRDAVLRAQEYIGQGDIYQANLSRGWRVQAGSAPAADALYRSLRQANPAPFAALAALPDMSVLSSSPERLVSVRGGRIETRPIAGTRARRGGAESDGSETRELLANPKERAEHVMLLDLERNDLGRICRAGSVEVSEFMVTESYPHLHHIVSNVRGQLRRDVTPAATLRAVFPGGTITGCPKYRCMQLIGELEGEPRGAYTGSLGYLNRNGDMDFNILIRTATLRGTRLEFRTGAGIVADSDWRRELAETRAKAQGMLRAFGAAAGPAADAAPWADTP